MENNTEILYLKDFEKAMCGEKFAIDVLATLDKVVKPEIISSDSLVKMIQSMFDLDNISQRKSYDVYDPNQDITIYNILMNDAMSYPSDEIKEALIKYDCEKYWKINPRNYFKK